jgi:hypothetical protein
MTVLAGRFIEVLRRRRIFTFSMMYRVIHAEQCMTRFTSRLVAVLVLVGAPLSAQRAPIAQQLSFTPDQVSS